MIYIINFIIFFVGAFSKQKDKLYNICCIYLVIFAGLRTKEIGQDTSSGYWINFNYIKSGMDVNWLEKGWVYLNKLAIILNVDYQGVLFFACVLMLFPVFYIINKESDNKLLSLAIYYGMYFVMFSFNLMRQSIAISFGMLFLYFWKNRRVKAAIISFAFALFFHKTVMLVLLIPLFAKIKLSLTRIYMMIIFSLGVGVVLSPELIIKLSGTYSSYFLMNDGYSGFRESIIIPFLFAVIVCVFFCFIFYYCIEKNGEIEKNIWLYTCIAGLVLMNITLQIGQGTRLVLYYSLSQILFVPQYIGKLKAVTTKYSLMLMFVIYLLLNFVRMLISDSQYLIPYENVLFWCMK